MWVANENKEFRKDMMIIGDHCEVDKNRKGIRHKLCWDLFLKSDEKLKSTVFLLMDMFIALYCLKPNDNYEGGQDWLNFQSFI